MRSLVLCAVVLGVAPGSAGAAVDFVPKQDFAVGQGPMAVAVGDFNGDRKPDLAVAASRTPGEVVVLLGDGMGSFRSPANFTTGGDNPTSVAVGDFNGDGHQDLAVADFLGMVPVSNVDTYASVLLGDGTGAFAAGTPFLVASGTAYPSSVSVTDLNGDGQHDLAFGAARYRSASSTYEGVISTLLGDGAGGFPDRNPLTVSTQVRSVAAADLNRDGTPDVATAMSGREDFTGRAAAWLGDGTGAFSNPASWFADAGTGSTSVAVGDFNADGRPDLALANYGSDDVSVFIGDGAGSFSGPTTFGAGDGPRSIAVGDFDADGRQDLAVVNAESRQASILVGTGTGTFAAPVNFGTGEISTLSGSRLAGDGGRVRVGDFDCNGTHDLAVANDVSGTVSVLMNARPGTAAPGCLPPDTAVDGAASAARTQKQPRRKVRVKVKVAAGENLVANAKGRVIVRRKSYKLKALTKPVAADETKKLVLSPKRKRDVATILDALSRGKKAKAKVGVKLTDEIGNVKSVAVTVTLRSSEA